jgi:hypothetical protein
MLQQEANSQGSKIPESNAQTRQFGEKGKNREQKKENE